MLFWSSHAAKSDWVLREAEYALGLQYVSGGDVPDIVPVMLEGPPAPLPPPVLAHLHFNDYYRYLISAAESAARPRPAI
jgi:hypothetical protein